MRKLDTSNILSSHLAAVDLDDVVLADLLLEDFGAVVDVLEHLAREVIDVLRG